MAPGRGVYESHPARGRLTPAAIRLPAMDPQVISPVLLAASTTASHGLGINWGDVPTWLAVAAASFAGWIALRQLRQQQEDIARQTRQLERQQADMIDLLLRTSTVIPPGIDLPAAGKPGHKRCYMAEVTNRSTRPIREVICWLDIGNNQKAVASKVGEFAQYGIASSASGAAYLGKDGLNRAYLIRAGQTFGFAFPFAASDYPDACVSLTFTDDSGLTWGIDPDLHLAVFRGSGPRPRPWRR